MLYRIYQIAKAIPGVATATNLALRLFRKIFWIYRPAPDVHGKPPEEYAAFIQGELGEDTSFVLVEVGAGDGRVLRSLALRYPAAQFVGVDIQKAAILAGREQLAKLEIGNVRLYCASCLDDALPWDCDYLISRTALIYLDRSQIVNFLKKRLPRIRKKALFEEIVSLTKKTEVSHFFAHPLADVMESASCGTFRAITTCIDYEPWKRKGRWSGARVILERLQKMPA